MKRKITIIIMTFVLAFMLVVETPVFAFAQDTPEVTEQIYENKEEAITAQTQETPETLETPETSETPAATETPAGSIVSETTETPTSQEPDDAVSELTPGVVITKGDTEFASDSVTYGDYTTSIKGLPDEKTETVLNGVATVVPELVGNREIYEFEIGGSVDAEKYSLDLSDYDSLLCWAGTASNMLWTSGYAQEAVNPFTGENFKSEDEVMDYCRKVFTDEAGDPAGVFDYLFEGVYPYMGEEGISLPRDENANYGGLLPEVDAGCGFIEQLCDDKGNDSDILSELNDLSDVSAGAWLRWFNVDENAYADGAHWLTIAGLTKDDTEADFRNKYKGIILADSDNTPVREDDYSSDSPEDRAKLAAAQPNIYTFYNLSWENLAGENAFVIVDYLNPLKYPMYRTVLGGLMWLTDRIIPEPSAPEESGSHDDNSSILIPAPVNPELDKIKALMVDGDMLVYSPANNQYSLENNDEFTLYVRNIRTALTNVYLDGVRLSENASNYKIDVLPNGLFKITLSKDLMKTLDKGNHELLLDFYTIDDVTVTIVVE
jgi:hypothetical protein